ncbi:SMP-30/gluconolactonase/LRE family protein [Lewinella sp. 4G2]|uniref:SMP-30/gluconolactonase/LRE family protein n=1 Tax=Lewinella sp. 4G2 TaxID=1803372 RepID=UPI0012F837BE|nr:SMP-30/gluconolactonase/LRE family protein [Lewinella sp. 4G2]
MSKPLFFVADAHEGPVWVAQQCRLYFTTKTHLDTYQRVDIMYLDFSQFGVCSEQELWADLPETAPLQIEAKLFYHDANMANSMCLSADGRALIVAEQGDKNRPSVISRIALADKTRSVLVDGFDGQPFNSLNKVILDQEGKLIISDPDYGFRQDFRPPPVLEPNIYSACPDGGLNCFRCNLEMPHGLALSPDEKYLFVTDTSNDGAHGDSIELKRRKSVWRFAYNAETGEISGEGKCCFAVAKGVPDGAVFAGEHLLVGGGDGVYVANQQGELLGKIPTEKTAVNVALAAEGKHLFVTADDGVYLFRNWINHLETEDSKNETASTGASKLQLADS